MSADAPEVPSRRRRWLRLWARWTLRLAALSVLLVVTGLFAWAWRDRGLPDVEAWHRVAPEGEFSTDMADGEFSFDDYLALEERMFGELSDWMIPAERASDYLRHSRFQRGGPSDPAGFERNWNRSVELVLFDVNDDIFMGGLYSHDPRAEIERLERTAGSTYTTTVITNHDTRGNAVVARTTAPGVAWSTTTEIGLSWPADVYSLSHVAIPLPPDDELYGYLSVRDRASRRLPIGRLALRGEKDVLRIAPAQLLRLRANPFHAYMLGRIEEALDALR